MAGGTNDSTRSSLLVAAGILLSRLSGLIREVVLASWMGVTTIAAEAFAFALNVPKLLQNLLGEGALSASFIPVYAEVVDQSPVRARRLAGAVFGLLAALVAALVLVLMLAARPIVAVIARGAGPERTDLMAELLQVMAPGIGFIVFAAWCLGILNAHRDFFLSYVTPVLWNAAIVVAAIVARTTSADPVDIARAAAWGVFIGGVAQFAVQLPRVLRTAGPITPSLDRTGAAVRQVLRRFAPGVAGRGVVTVGTFVDAALALFLAVGALSVLAKAQTLILLPISVFAMSIAAAELPELSRGDRVAERLQTGTRRVVFFLLFSAIAFVLGGRSIVAALFERGRFDGDDTIAVWLTLAAFAIGLPASGLSRLLQNASFARGDVAGPARIALVRLVIAAGIGLVLMFPFDRFAVINATVERSGDLGWGPLEAAVRNEEQRPRLGAVGLAVGSAVGAWIELGLLRARSGMAGSLGLAGALRTLAPGAVAAALLCGVIGELTRDLHGLIAAPLVLLPAGLIYVALAARRGEETARELLTATTARVAGRI